MSTPCLFNSQHTNQRPAFAKLLGWVPESTNKWVCQQQKLSWNDSMTDYKMDSQWQQIPYKRIGLEMRTWSQMRLKFSVPFKRVGAKLLEASQQRLNGDPKTCMSTTTEHWGWSICVNTQMLLVVSSYPRLFVSVVIAEIRNHQLVISHVMVAFTPLWSF